MVCCTGTEVKFSHGLGGPARVLPAGQAEGHGGLGLSPATGLRKGGQVNGAENPADDGMSLRAWARSRGIPVSTAHKAAVAGRITRRPDGRLDPERTDREWVVNTRTRVDGRVPTPPDNPAEEALVRRLLEDMKRPGDWCGEPGDEMVSMRVADAVGTSAYLMRAAALSQMVDRLAPMLAVLATVEGVREVLRQGLDEAEDAFAAAWEARWR